MFALMAATYAFMGGSQITSLGPFGKQPSIIYTIEDDGKRASVRLIPNADGTTTIKDITTGKSNKVNLDSYAKNITFVPTWTDKRDNMWINMVLGALSLIGSGFFLFLGFSNDYRRYKLRKLVAASAAET